MSLPVLWGLCLSCTPPLRIAVIPNLRPDCAGDASCDDVILGLTLSDLCSLLLLLVRDFSNCSLWTSSTKWRFAAGGGETGEYGEPGLRLPGDRSSGFPGNGGLGRRPGLNGSTSTGRWWLLPGIMPGCVRNGWRIALKYTACGDIKPPGSMTARLSVTMYRQNVRILSWVLNLIKSN